MSRAVRPLLLAGLLPALLLTLVGCGGTTSKPAATTNANASLIQNPRDRYGTVWLCRPRLLNNPCTSSLTTTVLGARAKQPSHVEHTPIAANPSIDCFYVYPTISPETTVNANLAIQPELREVAIAQAARFSHVCRVYAPVYRQITLTALSHPARITAANALTAYSGVLAAFRDYLAHYNHGRGIVFIGHSQGTSLLTHLLQQEVDDKPAVRHKVVSAILLGGNVTVRKGSLVGGDFAHLPACTSSTETGCVIAYSSFMSKPPANSEYARTGSDAGVKLLTPRDTSGLSIMCVNPAALGGGSGVLDPYFPSILVALLPGATTQGIATPWISIPDEYRAQCKTSGDATWLQVSGIPGSRLPLQGIHNSVIGLHLIDVNAALGNLVPLVASEAAAYGKR